MGHNAEYMEHTLNSSLHQIRSVIGCGGNYEADKYQRNILTVTNSAIFLSNEVIPHHT